MLLNADDLVRPDFAQAVLVQAATAEVRPVLLHFVAAQHPDFSTFYESPKPQTTALGAWVDGQLVGAVLLEEEPESADSGADAALACVVIDHQLRSKGYGSAVIHEVCQLAIARGYRRIIAGWVASESLYSKLGFHRWRTREVDG
jgi:GNAT superfamily N-acetyltransferase